MKRRKTQSANVDEGFTPPHTPPLPTPNTTLGIPPPHPWICPPCPYDRKGNRLKHCLPVNA